MSTEKKSEVVTSTIPQPEKIYCFHCRDHTIPSSLVLENTYFESKKLRKPMSRQTWVGVCSICGKNVRQFAKKAPVEELPKDQKQTEEPKEENKIPN